MNIDDLINDALNNPEPKGYTVLDFLSMPPNNMADRLADYIGKNISIELAISLGMAGMDIGSMAAGAIWAFNHVLQHGMPVDLEDIVEGRKD